MNIPEGMTEEEVIAIITKIGNRLAPQFTFGYHTIDDIKQQIFIIASHSFIKYDPSRPLENFLWISIRNGLKNFKRDEYERLDKPCFRCKEYDKEDVCQKHEDILSCKGYYNWYNRNQSKKNLVDTLGLANVSDEKEQHMSLECTTDETLINNDIKVLIDKSLPIILRADYLRMLANVHVPKTQRTKIQNSIREILNEHGYTEETW